MVHCLKQPLKELCGLRQFKGIVLLLTELSTESLVIVCLYNLTQCKFCIGPTESINCRLVIH